MKRIFLFILLILGMLVARAEERCGNIEVSVLTCSPGQEVYSYYGHTAIRVKDRNMGTDHVFNYGVFDFNSENFLWRFVLGQTDYMCVATPWKYFIPEYEKRGSSVVAQVLNLTEAEAMNVRDYLYNNIRKENCVYRYNFLKNNCTTKVMDCVDACVDGELVYSWVSEPCTYRGILREYTKDHLWSQEGNDVLLGADVDTTLSHRATCFIPEYYMNALQGAVVRNEFQDTRQLVLRNDTLVRARHNIVQTEETFPFSPIELGWGMFGVALLLVGVEFLCKKMMWMMDVLLMLVHGLAGCLICFLFFFSEHPALDSNWLIGILNPLPLILLPFVVKAAWKYTFTLWHYFMAVWMALYLLFIPWMPQQMGSLVVPVLAIMLSRQVSYILHYGRKSKVVSAIKSRKKSGKKK
jgi:hypothetical protein